VLVDGVLALVRRYRPIHISIVGGEPLVRYRELDVLLPKLDAMGIEVQLVTSAVRPIPPRWASLSCLHLAVSVDGLPEDHDRRRAPATYHRILQHIQGHQVIVHCTVTRQLLARSGYLQDFARFWSGRAEARKIWFSLFTPQEGQESEERLTPRDREYALEQLAGVAARFPKVDLPRRVLDTYRRPPSSPAECLFAQTTVSVTADLKTVIAPCQFGGRPVCSECGCLASAGLAAIGRYRVGNLVSIRDLFAWSQKVGKKVTKYPDSGGDPNRESLELLRPVSRASPLNGDATIQSGH
jgi:organic radical activating enzyme